MWPVTFCCRIPYRPFSYCHLFPPSLIYSIFLLNIRIMILQYFGIITLYTSYRLHNINQYWSILTKSHVYIIYIFATTYKKCNLLADTHPILYLPTLHTRCQYWHYHNVNYNYAHGYHINYKLKYKIAFLLFNYNYKIIK